MQSVKPAVLFSILAMLTLSVFAAVVFSPTVGKMAEARSDDTVRETPKYEVLGTVDATGLRKMEVATPAKTEADMRLVAEELRDENVPEDGTFLIEFNKLRDPSVDTGFALVFDDKNAVLDAGGGEISARYDESYDREEARRIMKKEGGIRVVSFEEFAEENPDIWEKTRHFLR